MYIRKWHKYLFEYNLVHSTISQKVYCEREALVADDDLKIMKQTSLDIYRVLERIYKGYKAEFKDVINYIPEFPLKDFILNLDREIKTPFWTRYDSFFSKDGVFFAEFNYDKPCAEREAFLIGEFKSKDNINLTFEEDFIKSILAKIGNEKNLAILCTDGYEEIHLAHLFKKKLRKHNINVLIAKKNNFDVINDEVFCFGIKVKTILRLYPTEKLYEVNNIEKILELFNESKVDIVNDPRIIILQSKELFIYLNNLLSKNSSLLSDAEKNAIKMSIPKTALLNDENIKKLEKRPSGVIIKPVLGRYSENIFIPEEYSDEQWKEIYKYILEEIKNKAYLIQEYKNIVGEHIPFYNGNKLGELYGYGNYGVFIIDGKYTGYATRWCTEPITNEWKTWSTPIETYKRSINYYNKEIDIRKLIEEAIFKCNFTGGYSGDRLYLDKKVLTISDEKAIELINATNSLCNIFKKVKNLVCNNFNLFKDILDIDYMQKFFCKKDLDILFCIGRLDWIVDYNGNLKLLEINAETPAGLNEAMEIEKLYLERLKDDNLVSFNSNMGELILEKVKSIISYYSNKKEIKTVAILGCTYYEDWYNNNTIYKLLKNNIKNIRFIQGNIYDLKIENDEAWLYGERIDAIYRYFPLDWFVKEGMLDISKGLNKNYFFINPANTIVCQSKGFLVVINELLKQGFFSNKEADIIKKYIPKTSYNYDDFIGEDYIYKPILGREGEGVEFSYNMNNIPNDGGILQEVIKSQKVRGVITSSTEAICEDLYPVIGTYIIGDKFGGVYTRLGGPVTNKECQYAPLLIQKGNRCYYERK